MPGEWLGLRRSKLSGNICTELSLLAILATVGLSTKHDAPAERLFQKALQVSDDHSPGVMNVDRNAAYPSAIDELIAEQTLSKTCRLRQNK